jgi:phenylpropionate dioxygenase-like ring-hydroxylating dioxygenase large terminal subunit
VPFRAEGYGTGLDTARWALLSPRTEIYRGLIFATLDPNAVSLEEYLGDFRWYMDIHFALEPDGLEVIGAPLRWVVPGNWKIAMENSTGDSYHTASLHRSISLANLRPPTVPHSDYSVHVANCNGHGASISRSAPGEVLYWGNGPGYEKYYRESGLSAEQLDLARRSVTGQGSVYPNFTWVHNFASDEQAGDQVGFFALSVLHPTSPTTIEMVRWMLAPAGATDAEKRRIYEISVANQGPSGLFEADDSIVWSGIVKMGSSPHARMSGAMLNYEMGMDPTSAARLIPNWPGPGDVYTSRLEDDLAKMLLRNWHKLMTSDEGGLA